MPEHRTKERTVQLHRIGSDAEFVFWDGAKVIPAERFAGNNQAARMRSWIGTDGHAATAEIRPGPAHNIKWHLLKIADALTEIHARLPVYEKEWKFPRPISLLAQPLAGQRETMGGHIWISMWYNSPLSAGMINGLGNIYDSQVAGGLRASRNSAPRWKGKVPTDKERVMYVQRAAQGDELGVDIAWRKLHHLLGPWEDAVFCAARKPREEIEILRLPNHEADRRPVPDDNRAFLLYEYRYPSTWLASPTLALTYLGLAKLAILNWDALPALQKLEKEFDEKAAQLEHLRQVAAFSGKKPTIGQVRGMNYDLFWARYKALVAHPKFHITNDLIPLQDALEKISAKPLPHPLPINLGAWVDLTKETL